MRRAMRRFSRTVARITAGTALAGLVLHGAPQAVQADPAVTVGIGDVVIGEGDVGARTAMLTLTQSSVAATDTIVSYTIGEGSASSPQDFKARSRTARIRAGRTTGTIVVRVEGDTLDEGDETVHVSLDDAGGVGLADALGVVTIRDDDPQVGPTLAIGDVDVIEGNSGKTQMRFPVTLDAPLPTDVAAQYLVVSGTAAAGVDMKSRSGTVRVRAGRTRATLTLPVLADVDPEADETFTVALSAPIGAVLTDDTGVGTIRDDDTPLVTTPGAPAITSVDAGPGNGMLTATWSAPTDDGGAPISGYDVEVTRPAEVVVGSYVGTAASFVCGSPGITCTLRVRAVNAEGPGPWSAPEDGTTWRAPDPVTALVVNGSNGSLSANWGLPADPGDFPILDYRVERSDDGVAFSFVEYTTFKAATVSCPGQATTCWVRIRARNAAGLGTAVDGSATTWALPDAPTITSIRRASGNLIGLSWSAPASNGGTAILDYTGERSTNGGVTWLSIGSVVTTTPTCLVGTTCSFRIRAVNLLGAGPVSNVATIGP